jgi:hypothetical protein
MAPGILQQTDPLPAEGAAKARQSFRHWTPVLDFLGSGIYNEAFAGS